VDDQGRGLPRGVGGAVVFERVKLHDATKQTNDSGPHSPFTSAAETHRASPTDVRPIRLGKKLHRPQVCVCSIMNKSLNYLRLREEHDDDIEWLSLMRAGVLHLTVQIIVTIYIWNRSSSISLNNIEQIAKKAGQ
jgi:hypothetical protein